MNYFYRLYFILLIFFIRKYTKKVSGFSDIGSTERSLI